MMFTHSLAAACLAILLRLASAQSSIVTGTCPGFAYGVTGGGSVTTVYPTTIAELKAYLTSSEPQNIVISGTFNFQGSEGSSVYEACSPYDCTVADGGQMLLNTLSGCGSHALSSVQLDTAAYEGINVASDKTLVGKNNAVLYGKGLRFVNVENIIIQNVAITNLNPRYVWGGDALSFSGTSKVSKFRLSDRGHALRLLVLIRSGSTM
jgi:pectin lyase